MKREEFKKVLALIKEFIQKEQEFMDFGIDLYECKNQIGDTVGKLIDLFFESHFLEEGQDWINWWMWENEFGENNLEAYDDQNNLICQTEDSLYDYIETYMK